MSSDLGREEEVKILLVDDRMSNLIALEAFLEQPGYRLVSVTSGEEALRHLVEEDFAVILTDVMMPVMDGFELASHIKEIPRAVDTPIIFMTAMDSGLADIFRGYNVGAVDYLQKPLEPEVVKAKVAVFVQLFRQKRLIQQQTQILLENERREQAYKISELERQTASQQAQIKNALRENAYKKRIELLQNIQLDVSRILAEADSMHEARPLILKTIALGMGWTWAALWTRDEDGSQLRLTSIWHEDDVGLQRFETLSRALHLQQGDDIPGRVWTTGEACWMSDAVDFYDNPRAALSHELGPHGVIAVPVHASGEVIAVIEFINPKVELVDPQRLAALIDICSRVGLYIQRQKTEFNLRESEEKFRLLIAGVKDYAIYMLDPRGHVKTWNSGAQRIKGYDSNEIIGRHFSCFYTEEACAAGAPAHDLAMAIERGQYEVEGIRVRKDGSTFWANCAFTTLRDSAGNLKGFSKVTRDITDRKEAEESLRRAHDALDVKVKARTLELEEANLALRKEVEERQRIEQLLRKKQEELVAAKELAEDANRAKSAFLANMSHEIRTPLGAVMGFSELMLMQDQSAVDRLRCVEAIKRNGKLLSNIINDILDLSKVEAGKLDVEKVEVPLAEILTDINMLLDLEATEKGLRLTLATEGKVPTRIKTDPLRLRQILFNIVGNAIKFTDHGSIAITLKRLTTADGAQKLAFEIRDTGRGIAKDQAARLFAPFAQADSSTTRRFGGTGLGLVLSRKLALSLGGDVELIESELDQGSCFLVTIDPGEVDLEQNFVPGKRKAESPFEEQPIQLNQMRILFVEDSLDNQLLVSRMLRMSGAIVDTATNGREGVEKALSGDYDVVLMDLQMPEMDGHAATQELRRFSYRKPIIALTAHAMAEERQRCLSEGFNSHLSKPINRKLLLSTLQEFRDFERERPLEPEAAASVGP